MSVATAWSDLPDTAAGFQAVVQRLRDRLAGEPDIIFCYYAGRHDPAVLAGLAAGLPHGVRIHGASSTRGMMTEAGIHMGPAVIAALGIRHANSHFGVALSVKGDDPRQAAADAVLAALRDAGRPGELPEMVMLAMTPGNEEAVLLGVADVVGGSVPILGGTAGAAGVGGPSHGTFTKSDWGDDAIVLTVVFPGFPLSVAVQGGCIPTPFHGEITAVDGPRTILKIDGMPAAKVYEDWCAEHNGAVKEAGMILRRYSALMPLGQVIDHIGDVSVFSLVHISEARDDGGLDVMVDVSPGQNIYLMIGGRGSLIGRAARAVETAMTMQCRDSCSVCGGVMMFCAGLMQELETELPQIQASIATAMMGRPFLTAFSFGEQGAVTGEHAVHTNLMISSLLLGQ